MKKYLYIGVMALALASCNDFLDELPDNRTELNTETSIAKLLVSAYPQTNLNLMSEFYSDNVDENSRSYSYTNKMEEDFYLLKDTYEEMQDTPFSGWGSFYAAIAAANQALKGIEDLGNPVSLEAYRGEALVCRAFSHFLLATTFCQPYDAATADTELGIPYVTESQNSVYQPTERGTLAETYENIKKDLEEGLPLISDDAYTIPKYHFNRKAACAFAARFYLYYMQPDFSNCQKVIDYATEALGGGYESLRDWKALGTLSSNGDVQPNAYIAASEASNLLLLSCISYQGGITDGGIVWGKRYSHNEVTAQEDCRSTGLWGGYTAFYQQPFSPGSGSPKVSFRRCTLIQKWTISGDAFYAYTVTPVFTTDETLITRAEAYALLKQYDNAAADISAWQNNFTSKKAEVTAQDIQDFYDKIADYTPEEPTVKKKLHPSFTLTPEQENFIHCVLHIRRILTLGEGVRWQDVRRYGITVYRRYFEGAELQEITDVMDKDDLRRVFQIPRSVSLAGVEANPR